MRILIDIGHPAHVHLFKHFAWNMQEKGHVVFFTAREKEYEIYLLTHYNFNFRSFGKHYKTRRGKLTGLLKFNLLLLFVSIKFRPDIFLSHGSIYFAHISWLLQKPHISFEDTFNFEQIRLYKPFTSVILTGNYPHPELGGKNIDFPGYHELAYLHPKRFQHIKNYGYTLLGLNNDDNYVVLRFVAWKATHDRGHFGLSTQMKKKIVLTFSKYAKVYISSEDPLPSELTKYKLHTPPEEIHHILCDAILVFGESATMITEAALLGTPGIYIDTSGRLYTDELENKYGLVFNFTESPIDQQRALMKGVEILQKKDFKKIINEIKNKMLQDKIDVTGYLIWFIENYPESRRTLKGNPDYHFRFR